MNSELFSIILGVDNNTWIKMNIFDIYNQMGMDIRPFINAKDLKISDMLELVLPLLRSTSQPTKV